MAGGIGVRVWAARTLGSSYTRTLRVAAGQRVISTGPYAIVRHPGYAADLLMWLGYGLAWSSLPAALTAIIPTFIAYAYRIAAEEAMMRAEFGPDYESYAVRTARLLPGVWCNFHRASPRFGSSGCGCLEYWRAAWSSF